MGALIGRPRQPADAWLAAALSASTALLYFGTLTPGLCFPAGDSHELALNAARLGLPHPSGYPLYTWLGHLFIRALPIGDAAYRMNAMSAVLAAAAVGLLYAILRRLAILPLLAAGAALLFGLSTTVWSQAVITEVYTADAALLTLTIWLLLGWAARVAGDAPDAGARRWLLAFAVAYGASLGTHLSNLTFAPAYALFVVLIDPTILRRPGQIAVTAGAFTLATLQYLWLPWRGGTFDLFPNVTPDTLAGFWRYTLGAFANQRFAFPLHAVPGRIYFVGTLMQQNFGWLGLLLGGAGMWVLMRRRPAEAWLFLGIWVANFAFCSQLAVPDPDVFFIPGYVPWVVFIAHGADALADFAARGGPGRWRALSLPALLLAAALVPIGWSSFGDNDRRQDTVVDDFGREVFRMLPPDAAVVGPRGAFGAALPFWQTARGVRPDVVIVGQRGAVVPDGAARFAAVALADGVPTPTARVGQRPEDLPPDAWYLPVLLGNRGAQVLSRISLSPPTLTVTDVPAAARVATHDADPLLGFAAAPVPDARRVHLATWWRGGVAGDLVLTIRLDDTTLATYQAGAGTVARYVRTFGLADDAIVHEAIDVTVPAWIPAGRHQIALGVTRATATQLHTTWIGHRDVTLE